MASARPPGGGSSATPQARIGFDYSALRSAPNVAREAGRGVARELQQSLKVVQGEQRIVLEQARQTTAVIRAQQSQITAVTRAESSTRTSLSRAERVEREQAARRETIAFSEEQKRQTAAYKSELRERERANRQAQVSAGALGRGVASFAGAALGGIGGPVGALAGGLIGGSPAMVAGLALAQTAKSAVEASQTATAYDRQRVAALNLAGSQAKLNELTTAYTRATGGAIDKAAALSQITRLQATGFANSAKELEVFVRGVRGSSIAMGKTQDEIGQEVQLAISNRSFKRLDQIGLGIKETTDRITKLRAANRGLDEDAAFQQAVLGLLGDKFGTLADSVEGQATGVEKLTRAWADLRLEMGKAAQGPINTIAGGIAERVDATAEVIRIEQNKAAKRQLEGPRNVLQGAMAGRERVLDDIATGARPASQTGPLLEDLNRQIRNASMEIAKLSAQRLLASGDLPQGAPDIRGGAAMPTAAEFKDEQKDLMVQRYEALNEITRNANREIADITRQGASQRASVIAQYEKSIAREAEDFARQRANAERKLQFAILDVHQDSARQRVKWEADLARNIAQAEADSAERVADLRGDATKRLAESEKNYARDAEKRQRQYTKTIREAAANLDAVAVREAQVRYREEKAEAKEAHEEQKRDLQAQLQERLDDEAKSLAKSIKQQRDANQRRVEEQAENDRLRIEEMKAAFEEQKQQESEERGIRLERQAEDHEAQLIEMANQQAERIQQIKDHAQADRDEVDRQHQIALAATGLKTEAWIKQQELLVNSAIASHKKFWEELTKPQIGPNGQPAGFPKLAHPFQYVPPIPSVGSPFGAGASNARNVSMGDITVQVLGSTNMSESQLYDVVYRAITHVMETPQ